jgi:hypothetical protein
VDVDDDDDVEDDDVEDVELDEDVDVCRLRTL